MRLPVLILLAASLLAWPRLHLAEDFVFRHENLLGTSMELHIRTDVASDARAAESALLDEIQRLSAILSTWNPESEVMRLFQGEAGDREVSEDLFAVLGLCDAWQRETQGAFNPRVKVLGDLWTRAEQRQELPGEAELAQARRELLQPAWERMEEGTRVRVPGGRDATLSAVAKAYIVDRAGEAAFSFLPSPGGVLLLNLGGDIRHWGNESLVAGVVDPHADAENRAPVAEVPLRNQALATSGGYRRGWTIGGRLHSHVLDPRSGMPVSGIASASVIAPDAATANALAVSLNVLGVEEGVRLVSSHPSVEYLVIAADGSQHRSPGWPEGPSSLLAAADETAAAETLQAAEPASGALEDMEFLLTFEFPAKSKRPYIAAWIADEDGFPIRTLLLWIVQGKERLEWLPDLRQWYRQDKARRLIDPTDLVATRSSATRRAGEYSAFWDGLDDNRLPVPEGDYVFYLEAAREDGTHQVIKHPFSWNGQPFAVDLPGNVEITSARIECSKVE